MRPPYGYPAAIDSMGMFAAPLLASGSVALIAVVLSSTATFRWSNPALFLLVIAAAAFVATVEFTFMARQYVVAPPDLEVWWPDAAVPERRERLRSIQRQHVRLFRSWSNRARMTYNTAILALSLGIAVLLVPTGDLDAANPFRLAAVAAAALAFAAEALWILFGRSADPTLPVAGPEHDLTP
jgi:hypothetical protein